MPDTGAVPRRKYDGSDDPRVINGIARAVALLAERREIDIQRLHIGVDLTDQAAIDDRVEQFRRRLEIDRDLYFLLRRLNRDLRVTKEYLAKQLDLRRPALNDFLGGRMRTTGT